MSRSKGKRAAQRLQKAMAEHPINAAKTKLIESGKRGKLLLLVGLPWPIARIVLEHHERIV